MRRHPPQDHIFRLHWERTLGGWFDVLPVYKLSRRAPDGWRRRLERRQRTPIRPQNRAAP